MKKIRILKSILTRTHAGDILIGYLVFVLAAALVITIAEDGIKTYRDALWYCYAVISTAGFGDIVVTTPVGKIVSIILTAYSLFVIAIVTGVVVNYYTQIISIQQKETIASFLDRLERLPELSKEELEELSQKAAFFKGKRKKH